MSTGRRLGVVMDPIAGINYAKDSTLAMLLAAPARGFALAYLEQKDLSLRVEQTENAVAAQVGELDDRIQRHGTTSAIKPL